MPLSPFQISMIWSSPISKKRSCHSEDTVAKWAPVQSSDLRSWFYHHTDDYPPKFQRQIHQYDFLKGKQEENVDLCE